MFLVEHALLWPFFGMLIAIGWMIDHARRLIWWLLRLPGRGIAALWSKLDDVTEGHPVQVALITVVVLGVIVAPATWPTWGSWVQRLTQSEAAAETTLPTGVPVALPPLLAPTVTPEPPRDCGQARITALAVHLRPAAGTDNTPLARLAQGTVVELLCSEAILVDGSRWVLVQTEEGKEGWVSAKYVQVLS